MPIEAKAREVRIQARNVRSVGTIRTTYQVILEYNGLLYQEPGDRERHYPYFPTRERQIGLRTDYAMTGAALWAGLAGDFACDWRYLHLR